jgi:hypothetical protein
MIALYLLLPYIIFNSGFIKIVYQKSCFLKTAKVLAVSADFLLGLFFDSEMSDWQ